MASSTTPCPPTQASSSGASTASCSRNGGCRSAAVFVIDADGTVAHAEYVADHMSEPDYDAAVRAARAAGAP